MPLARIITRSPEHTSGLSQQLQLEGFSVEIAAPGEIHLQPADLEIDFYRCNPAEVLQRASLRAAELGADVVVASGVLDLVVQPTAAPVEPRPVEVAGIQGQPESIQPVPVEAISPEANPAQPVAAQAAEEELSHELPPYNPHFAANLGTQLRESLAGLGAATGQIRKRLVEHLRTAAAGLRSRMANRTHEYQERMRQKTADEQAAWEHQRAEIAGRHAEMQQLPDVDLPAQKQPEPELAAAAATVQESSPDAPASVPRPAVPLRSKVASRRRAPLQLRGIFTGAAAATVLFVVGIVLANVHQQSPWPPGMTQTPGEQHVPFGAIIVQGRPAQSKDTIAQPKIVTPPQKPQPRESRGVTAHKEPHPYHKHAAAHKSNDDVTVDDVTVRHLPSPVRRPIQQARFKRYSDLE